MGYSFKIIAIILNIKSESIEKLQFKDIILLI